MAIRKLLLWACSADSFPSLILSGGRTTIFSLCTKNLRRASKALQNDLQQADPVHVFGQTVGDRRHRGGTMVPLPKAGSALASQRTQPDWHLRENARVWHSDECRVILSTCDRAWRCWVAHMLLPATFSSVTNLAVGQ